MSGDSSGFEDAAAFPPPPPPPTEISLLELPPKMPSQPGNDGFHVKELEIWPCVSALPPVQMSSEVEDSNKGIESMQNGQFPNPPSPPSLPKETTLPPPPPPPPLPQPDLTKDVPVTAPNSVQDSLPAPGKLSPSPGKDGPPLPTKPKPKL